MRRVVLLSFGCSVLSIVFVVVPHSARLVTDVIPEVQVPQRATTAAPSSPTPVQACSRSIRKRIPATYNLGIGLCVPSVIYHCCGHGASIYLSQWRSFFNDDVPMKRKIPSQCGIIISGSTLKEVTCIRWRCKKNKGDALKLIFLPSRIRAPPPVTGQV